MMPKKKEYTPAQKAQFQKDWVNSLSRYNTTKERAQWKEMTFEMFRDEKYKSPEAYQGPSLDRLQDIIRKHYWDEEVLLEKAKKLAVKRGLFD